MESTIEPRKRTMLLVGMALAIMGAVLMMVTARIESQTSDEGIYVVSGVSYWNTGDFRLNVEHPPLLKRLFALPVVGSIRFDPRPSDWEGASQWDVAPYTLYENKVPGQILLFRARLMNIILTVGLLFLAMWWARKTWGNLAGIVTGVLVAFEPNVLANGHLATTDVGYTLGVLGSVFSFGLFLERPTQTRLVVAALVFALALLTRFNALILIFLLPFEYLVVRLTNRQPLNLPRGTGRRMVLTFAAMSVVAAWVMYGFELRPLNAVQDGVARAYLGSLGTLVTSLPLPAASYVSGLFWQLAHNANGQWAYLFGKVSHDGWWYYFPMAMVIKMTLVSLLLAVLGAILALRGGSQNGSNRVFSGRFIAVPFLFLLGSSLFSRLNLGVRYVLPSIVLLLILAGSVVTIVHRRKVLGVVVGVLLLLHVASTVRYFPHFIPYANEAFGGPTKLSNFLIDSNLDWGQDMPLLSNYLERKGITEYRFRSFTTAPARVYGLYESDIPTDEEVAVQPFSGVVAIGRSVLFYPTLHYEWLKKIKPTAVLGYSINVYDLR